MKALFWIMFICFLCFTSQLNLKGKKCFGACAKCKSECNINCKNKGDYYLCEKTGKKYKIEE